MFVPVACPECGKPFQVPRGSVGQPATCPWCQKTVAALPVAGTTRPLSLDEAEQLPPVPQASRPATRLPVVRLLLLAAVCVAIGVATFLISRHGSGWLGGNSGQAFAPPDGYCRVKLPAEPVEEPVAANQESPVVRGGKRFVARRPSDGFTAEVGWLDLDPERAKLTRAEDAITAERARRPGTVTREAAVRYGDSIGREYQIDSPDGFRIERYLYVGEGPRPRLYVVAAGGPAATEEACRSVIDSFHLDP